MLLLLVVLILTILAGHSGDWTSGCGSSGKNGVLIIHCIPYLRGEEKGKVFKAAYSGDSEAMFRISKHYIYADSSYGLGMTWQGRAAMLGHIKAQYNMAYDYKTFPSLLRLGLPVAAYWALACANQGDIDCAKMLVELEGESWASRQLINLYDSLGWADWAAIRELAK